MDNLGRKIKEIREKAKLSQLELSEKIGISRVSVSQLENGERKACSEEIIKLAGVFNISTDYLLGLEKEPVVKLEEPAAEYAVKQDIRISVPSIKKNKFIEVLLYLLEKTAGKPNIGETVIYKLLYFADCNYYEYMKSR